MTYTNTESQIVTLLEGYLEGDRSLEQFLADFALLSWNSHGVGETGAERLANAIELRVAEYSNGDWSRERLNEHLADILVQHPDTTITEWRLTAGDRYWVSASWSESALADRERATVAW